MNHEMKINYVVSDHNSITYIFVFDGNLHLYASINKLELARVW